MVLCQTQLRQGSPGSNLNLSSNYINTGNLLGNCVFNLTVDSLALRYTESKTGKTHILGLISMK